MSATIGSILARRSISRDITPTDARRVIDAGLAAHRDAQPGAIVPGSRLHAWLSAKAGDRRAEG